MRTERARGREHGQGGQLLRPNFLMCSARWSSSCSRRSTSRSRVSRFWKREAAGSSKGLASREWVDANGFWVNSAAGGQRGRGRFGGDIHMWWLGVMEMDAPPLQCLCYVHDIKHRRGCVYLRQVAMFSLLIVALFAALSLSVSARPAQRSGHSHMNSTSPVPSPTTNPSSAPYTPTTTSVPVSSPTPTAVSLAAYTGG